MPFADKENTRYETRENRVVNTRENTDYELRTFMNIWYNENTSAFEHPILANGHSPCTPSAT